MRGFQDVAIVGLACRFPDAQDAAQFHRNLLEGVDSVRGIPADRLKYGTIHPETAYPPMGYIDRIDLFDHKFFNISKREAEFMDPQQRITLQLVSAAIENAGCSISSLAGTRTGVFLSATKPDYLRMLRQTDPLELLGNAPSALPGRVSYLLDLRGPAVATDSGCCSSLVSVYQACLELMRGESPFAIAGGFSLSVVPDPVSVAESFTEILSKDGRCKAFDASADGAAGGEGGAVVVLKLLEDAVADGDHIHAVIKGGAVNQNGFRSNGLSAPSPAAQTEVIRSALRSGDIDPATIGYVEAHGSGTRLGDVLEVKGLTDAFAGSRLSGDLLPIGSVKTNVGHLDHAAGIAGLVKAVLSVQNKVLYPSLHFNTPNPLVDWDTVTVQAEASEWQSDSPRRAGVSSFSLAGTNVHMVVEEGPEAIKSDPRKGSQVVTISAKSEESFRRNCAVVSAAVRSSHHSFDEIAHVLNRGRDDLPIRAATVVDRTEDLAEWLETLAGPAEEPALSTGVRDLVLLFSGDAEFSAPQVAALEAFEGFEKAAHEFREALAGKRSTRRVDLLFIHYCLHAMLRSFGFVESAVAGTGAGNLAVKVVRDGMPLAAAIEIALSDAEDPPLDRTRLHQMLEHLAPSRPVFIEMAAGGLLSREIETLNGQERFDLIPILGTDPLTTVAHLYESGVRIDWDLHYSTRKIQRVQLPSYQFDEIRCWCREIGDDFIEGEHAEHLQKESVAEAAGTSSAVIGDFANDAQRKVAVVWKEALKAEVLEPASDYFDLGGTSITGLTVIEGIERELGVRISFQDLYEHSTVASLAAHVESLRTVEEVLHADEPELVRIPRDGYLPVSLGQEQIWFIDQLEGKSSLYNIPFDLHMKGVLDRDALFKSVNALIERHEVVRTSFVEVEGKPMGRVEDFQGLDIPFVDISGLPQQERRPRALELFEAEASKAFDLDKAPLVRCVLLKLDEEEHVLLMTFHHIVYDGWTPAVLHKEISEMYAAFAAGREPKLEPLPIQFADFAAWQREWMAGDRLKRELAYWVEHLDGYEDVDFPFDRPRPKSQSYRGGFIDFEVPQDLADRLREMSRDEGVTLFTTMMAALNTFVHRYSGAEDIVIGTPAAGRRRPEVRGLIGYFNNMLPLRTDLRGDPTFRELVHRTVNVAAGGLDHEEVPFEKIVDAIRPERDLSRNPIFQIAYTHQNAPYEEYDLPGLEIQMYGEGNIRGIAPGTSKFDLTIGIGDQGGGVLEGYVEYALDLFDPETADRMLDHYIRILRAIVDNPDLRLSEIPMMGEEETAEVLRFSKGRPSYASELITTRISEWARRTPNAPAVEDEAKSLTYLELENAATDLAGRLGQQGVGKGDVVVVLLPNSVDLIVAQLAVMKIGAAYLPVDPKLPPKRISFILSDSDAAIVATTSDLSHLAGRTQVVSMNGGASRREIVEITPSDLAYVIYTSGSTGRPKGAELEHRGLANLVSWAAREFGIAPGDRASQVAGLSFDATIWEIWPPLAAGATLVVCPDEPRSDPAELMRWFATKSITMAFAPTPMMELLLAEEIPEGFKVRLLSAGGDKLLGRPRPNMDAKVVTLYGPTECTCIATCGYVGPSDESGRAPHIGSPIAGAEVYILGRNMKPCPVGVVGEIYIAGAGVGRGYVNLPNEERARFFANPFGEGRIYRTGDRGRWLRSGVIEFLGRLDDQVKVRGFRIEPGEVEIQLRRHPSVLEAAVVPVDTGAKDRRLAAYFTARDDLSVQELRDHLAELLPDYMIPTWFTRLEKLPLNSNGKVDKKQLPKPEVSGVAQHAEPTTDEERILAGIWKEVLGADRVGVTDNFFDLGGDSILSIQIVSRAARSGLKLRPRHLFQHQTVAELAKVVTADDSASRPAEARDSNARFATPIQRWAIDLGFGAEPHFNQAVVVEVPGTLDQEILKKALAHLATLHDALRLELKGSELAVSESPQVPLAIYEDDTNLDEKFEEVQRRTDPSSGIILSAGLVESAEGRSLLLLAAHHLAVDAVSWSTIVKDLEVTYLALLEGREPPRSAGPSFREWAVSLASSAERFTDEIPHWRRVLAASAIDIPQDLDVPGANTRDSEITHTVEVPSSLDGSTAEPVLLAALGLAARDLTGGSLLVDREGHGREDLFEDVDPSGIVGWFTALQPVLLETDPNDPEGSVARIQEALSTTSFSGVGFGVLKSYHPDESVRRDLDARRPKVVFNYLGRIDRVLGSEGTFRITERSPGPLNAPGALRPHEIEVEALAAADSLTVHFGYSSNLHREETIVRLAESFQKWLRILTGAEDPVRFRLARLSEDQLVRITTEHPTVQDIYPLTPMQQGLLFHSLYSETDRLYFEQIVFEVKGTLDRSRFGEAWQRAAAMHDLLRAGVVWEGVEVPHFFVLREAPLEVRTVDWRKVSGSELDRRLKKFLEEDSTAGFDLSVPPLARLNVISLGAERHLMVLSHHHVLMDGWSLQLLLGQALAYYRGEEPPKDPGGFSAFVEWLDRQDMTVSQEFWRERLAGFSEPTLLELPSPGEGESGYAMVSSTFERELTERVQAFCRAQRLTMNTVMLGAWARVVATFSGESDVVFGATTSLRPHDLPGAESIVGLFINTLPVRVRMAPDDKVGEWLARLQADQAEAREHSHISLAEVQSWSECPPTAPLFDSILVFENYPVDASWDESGDLQLGGMPLLEQTNYPLTVVIAPEDDIHLRITYDRSRLNEEAATELGGRMAIALDELIADPARDLGRTLPLTEPERTSPGIRGKAAVTSAKPSLIHQRFSEQASRTPTSIAVVHGDRALTYAELAIMSDGVAAQLSSRGVAAESLVGICMERSPQMIAALLGIMKAGGAYVPLDPAYPRKRLEFMAEDSNIDVVVTEEQLKTLLPASVKPLVLKPSRKAKGPDIKKPKLSDRNLAYVLYTSGSTGTPKGVAIEHRNVAALLDWCANEFGDDLSHVLASTSINFDISVFEIFGPLTTGGTVHLVKDALELMSRGDVASDVTLVDVVPSTMNEMLNFGRLPESIKTVNLAGEPVTMELLGRLFALSKPDRIYNLYGPTEDTTFSTFSRLRANAAVTVGRPISGTSAYILDSNLNPQPNGAMGEVFLGGAGVSRGYLNRPSLTAERYLPDPYGPPGSRMYRVGDFGRINRSGEIEYLGRVDFQIKIRGYRVEAGEVEAIIGGHPRVVDTVVVERTTAGDKHLVCYYVPVNGPVPAEELRDLAALHLPAHMVPSLFVPIESLPTTPNGKIDRGALPAPGERVRAGRRSPSGPAEELIANIWSEVLSAKDVGGDDDFFELGGHSLTATRLISRLREAFSIEVPLPLAFEKPTVGLQAEAISELWGGREMADEVARTYVEVQSMPEEEAAALLEKYSADS